MMRYAISAALIVAAGLTTHVCAKEPSREALHRQLEALAADGQPQGMNGWSMVLDVARRIEEIESEEEDRYYEKHGDSAHADYGLLYCESGEIERDAELVLGDLNFTGAILLPRIRSEGVFDQLNTALTQPRFLTAFDFDSVLDSTSGLRRIAKAVAGDAALAAQQGDFTIARERLDQLQHLSHIAALQLVPMAILMSQSTGAIFNDVVVHILQMPDVDAATCEHVMKSVADRNSVDESRAEQAAILELLSVTSELYKDDGSLDKDEAKRTRDAVGWMAGFIPETSDADEEPGLPAWPATWTECVENADAIFGPTVKKIWTTSQKHQVTITMEAEGCRLLAAVRLYQLEHDSLPATLDDLTPELLDVLPTDPTNGKQFGYKQLSNDPFDRSFIIYSYGADGVDNGGRQHRQSVHDALKPEFPGFDFPINHVVYPD